MVISFGFGYFFGLDCGYDEFFLILMVFMLRYYVEKLGLDVNDIDFLFDGKIFEEYYFEDLVVLLKMNEKLMYILVLVLVSYGYISLYFSREWKFQCLVFFGIQEDMLSLLFGDEL